jgi:hypothetical protein
MPAGITLTELCLYEILVSVFIIAQRGCITPPLAAGIIY